MPAKEILFGYDARLQIAKGGVALLRTLPALEKLVLSGEQKVVRVALQNAASVASLMLTTEVAITERAT